MSVIFYILTVSGVLLVTGFAQDNITNTDNTTDESSFTATKAVTIVLPDHVNRTSLEEFSTSNSNTSVPSAGSNASENETTNVEPIINTTVSPDQESRDVITPGPGPSATTTKKSTITSTTMSTTTLKNTHTNTHHESPNNSAYVVALIIFILVIAVVAVIFFCVKANRRRFSVDIQAKNEDAQIPLAAVETDVCFASPGVDLKTFTTPEETPDTKEEGAPTEADHQVQESPPETQTTEAPAEQPAEPKVMDDTDGDPAASTKTSVETLNDVLNENNNNNAGSQPDVSVMFFEIGLKD